MRLAFPSAQAIPAGVWIWPNINPATEWACKGDGTIVVETDFMDRLQALRTAFGKPIVIDSGYRSPAYNLLAAHTGEDGPHTTAKAVDLAVSGDDAYTILKLALAMGFTGIGVQQKGPFQTRFLHLDCCDNTPDTPRPRIWSY